MIVNGYMLFSNRAMGVSMTKVIHHLTKRLASKKRDTANHSGKVRTHQVQSSSHQHRKPSQMTCHDPNNPFFIADQGEASRVKPSPFNTKSLLWLEISWDGITGLQVWNSWFT